MDYFLANITILEIISRTNLLSFTTQNIGLFLKVPLKFQQFILSFAILLNSVRYQRGLNK